MRSHLLLRMVWSKHDPQLYITYGRSSDWVCVCMQTSGFGPQNTQTQPDTDTEEDTRNTRRTKDREMVCCWKRSRRCAWGCYCFDVGKYMLHASFCPLLSVCARVGVYCQTSGCVSVALSGKCNKTPNSQVWCHNPNNVNYMEVWITNYALWILGVRCTFLFVRKIGETQPALFFSHSSSLALYLMR